MTDVEKYSQPVGCEGDGGDGKSGESLPSFPHQNTPWPLEMEFVVGGTDSVMLGSLSRPYALGQERIFNLRNKSRNWLVCLMTGSTSHFTT